MDLKNKVDKRLNAIMMSGGVASKLECCNDGNCCGVKGFNDVTQGL